MSTYFEDDYHGRLPDDFTGILVEIEMYFKDDCVGGWSSYYCKKTWNDETLENAADLEIFDLLLNIDIKNGADSSKIVYSLCRNGAFEAVKVRFRLIYRDIKRLPITKFHNLYSMFLFNRIL